jgi:putative ABC transport system permease protein
MRTSLALSNIRHNPGRSALSLGGISIAIVLMFMQLGFLGAVENTATTIYSKLDFDLVVRSPEYLYLAAPRQIPRSVLDEIAGMERVERVVPFHVAMAFWRHPAGMTLRGMVLMGVNPDVSTFQDAEISADFHKLSSPEALLIDQKTHKEYGPKNGRRFSAEDVGVVTDLSQKRVQIVGLFALGSGLTANGAAIVNERGFDRIDPQDSFNNVSLGLIKLKPDSDPARAAAMIQHQFALPSGKSIVDVLTRDQVIRRELNRWIGETPIGFVFTLGVAISLVVGGAIVYMVLSTDVSNRLREYATLKAMGYTGGFLSRVVMQQAAYLAIFAFVPALFFSLVFYATAAWLSNLPIFMTWTRLAFVFALALLMCLTSAALAVRKLWKADPAELF